MAEQEESKKEEFAKEFMAEEGLKGKARRIKISSAASNSWGLPG